MNLAFHCWIIRNKKWIILFVQVFLSRDWHMLQLCCKASFCKQRLVNTPRLSNGPHVFSYAVWNWELMSIILFLDSCQSHEGGELGSCHMHESPSPVWVEFNPHLYDRMSGRFNTPLYGWHESKNRITCLTGFPSVSHPGWNPTGAGLAKSDFTPHLYTLWQK